MAIIENPGPTGAAGSGVPAGGTAHQALVKVSGTDYDTTWTATLTGFTLVTPVLGVATGTSLALSQGTISTNLKALSISVTWNNILTAFDAPIFLNVVNSASAAGSLLFDLQVGGVTQFSGDPSGNFVAIGGVTAASVAVTDGTFSGKARNVTATALGASGTVSLDPTLGEVFTCTPTNNITLNAASAAIGTRVTVVVTTSGTSSFNITPTTNFKSTGALATGTSSGKVFTISFIGDGTNLNETSRTTAM